jgi:putative phosphoribosyl transferase
VNPGKKGEPAGKEREVTLDAAGVPLEATLHIPRGASAIVVFAHGSGSSRRSPRNRFVAHGFQSRGIATLLLDLLTVSEEAVDLQTGQHRFDIPLLAERVIGATEWLLRQPDTKNLRIGYFGASTGAGAALVAAAQMPDVIAAVVSRGGRPDLAGEWLGSVYAPTLLIVGGDDEPVITLNREALTHLGARQKELVLIPGATHLFEEPGTLEEVAQIAGDWFAHYLTAAAEAPRATAAAHQ